MEDKNNISYGINFLELLAIVFIALKLTGYIQWSWWLVLAPLWFPIIPIILLVLVLIIIELYSSRG